MALVDQMRKNWIDNKLELVYIFMCVICSLCLNGTSKRLELRKMDQNLLEMMQWIPLILVTPFSQYCKFSPWSAS